MKALVCLAPGELQLAARAAPGAPAFGWANVAIRHVGICGTDYHIFGGNQPFLTYPRVMGHELSGTVSAVGRGVDLPIGAPVVVNPYISCRACAACRKGKPNCCMSIEVLGVHIDGGMCEEISVPAANLYPAEGLSLRDAAMVEFLAIGAHAARRAAAVPGESALVVGIGPIGLGAALFARIAGLRVTLLDSSPERLAFARDVLQFTSAATAREQAMERAGGDGFDVVFDATGNAAAIEAGFALVAHGGRYVLVSIVKDRISFADPEFHKREMSLLGSRNALKVDFDHVMAKIRSGVLPLGALATHRTTLEDMPRDMALWSHDKRGLIKAIIDI